MLETWGRVVWIGHVLQLAEQSCDTNIVLHQFQICQLLKKLYFFSSEDNKICNTVNGITLIDL